LDTLTLLLITVGAVILSGIGISIGLKVGSQGLLTIPKQNYKNLLITLVPMIAILGVISSIIFFGFQQPANNSVVISGAIMWLAVYVFAVIAWFTNRKKAGKILLDVRPFPARIPNFISAGLIIVLGFLGTYSFYWRDSEYAWLVSSIIGLSIGIFQVFIGLSRIQVYENGILAYIDLMKWEKIESFNWVSDNQKAYTLKLRLKGRLPGFLRNSALPIPIEKKRKLEAILEKYLAVISSAQNRA
jgi:hypothetical protein